MKYATVGAQASHSQRERKVPYEEMVIFVYVFRVLLCAVFCPVWKALEITYWHISFAFPNPINLLRSNPIQ